MKTYHDIQGDGGSDVLGQVQALARQIDQALSSVKRLIAVGSGKGGVGKSTLTMALAYAFSRALSRQGAEGQRVTILDADLNGPSQARLAGLEGRPWVPGDRGLVAPRRADGIGVVSVGSLLPDAAPLAFETVSSGEQQTWRATREMALFAQILAGTDWGELDVLLLDLPPGTERTVQFAQTLAGLGRVGLVMVTIPSAIARGVVARTLSALSELTDSENGDGGPQVLGYVENMAGYYCHDCGAVRPLFPEADPDDATLDAPCLGRIPFDPELAALCDRGWPDDELPAAGTGAEAEEGAARSADGLAGALRAVDAVARRLLTGVPGAGRPSDAATNPPPDSQPTHQEAPR